MDMRHDDFDDLLGGSPETTRPGALAGATGSKVREDSTPSEKDTVARSVPQESVDSGDHDDLLGSPRTSALDMPVPVSIFKDVKAASMSRTRLSVRQVAGLIVNTKAERKDELPLLKMGRFGDASKPKKDGTPGRCLRWDENMLSASGIEGDYDAGLVSMESAAAMLECAGIAALLYTSTHHTPEEPRWRVLCPLAREVSRHERAALCARLNGALGGILGEESFKPSQSYYFGEAAMRDAKKGGGKAHPLETLLIEGKPLDKVRGITPVFARPQDDDDLDDLLGSNAGRKGQGKTGKPWSVILSALWAVPNNSGKPNWQFLWDIAASLHEESDGADNGFAALDAWAKQHPSYDRKVCRDIWRGLRAGQDGNIGGGTILAEAKKHGWIDPSEDRLEDVFTDQDEQEAPTPKAKEDKPSSRLTFLSPSECASAPARRYLIKGIIAERDVACVFGAPGAGKSLLTPFLAYAVAQGREAFGMRTKQGGVFYVAAEDEHGMQGRVRALQQAHGDTDNFRLVGGVSNLLAADSPDLKDLALAVKAQKPKLIVIDTLAMAFPGLEENSAEGMGQVVAVARALTKWGASVILVHHDTKAESGTPRGSSVFNGALDMAIHLKRDDSGVIRGKLTKNRNGSCDRDIAFRIAIVDGGVDEDGDQITLPRCEELSASEAPAPVKLTKAERAVMDMIHLAGGEVPEAELRRLCLEGHKVSTSENPEAKRKAVYRALGGLEEKRRIVIEGGQVSASVPRHSIEDEFAECGDDLGG